MADFTVDDLIRGMTAEISQGETVKKSDVAAELQQILDKFVDNFSEKLDSAANLIKSVGDAYKTGFNKKEIKNQAPKLKDVGNMSLQGMTKGFRSALSGGLGSVSSPLDVMSGLMKTVRNLLNVNIKQNDRFVFGSAQHIIIEDIDGKVMKQLRGGEFGAGGAKDTFLSGIKNIGEVGGTAIALKSIFEGALVGEYEFIRGMREIAYQTDALDSSMFNLQGRLRDIGKQVQYTGVNRQKFLTAYMKNLKKGIKSQQQSLKVTQIGLFTGKQLGMDAEATASRFHDWHMQLRLNTGELQVLSGATSEIAKTTGVTGENLEQAVQASDKFMKNLRNSASLSATGAKNMIGMTAAAQKYGVEEQVSSIQQALSSLSDFRRTDAGFRAFLMRAGELAGVAHEVFTTEVMHDPKLGTRFVGGLKKQMDLILKMAPDARGYLSGNILEADLQDIPFEIRQYLNEMTQQLTGGAFKGLGDMQLAIKSTEEGFMSFEERMKKLKTERDQSFRTTQEYMQYQQKIASSTLQKTGQLLNEYNTAITKADKLDLTGKPLEELFAKSGSRFKTEMERSAGAFAELGLAGTSHEEKINGLYKTRFNLVAKMGNEFDVDIKSTSKMMQKALQGPKDKRDSLIREAMTTLNEDLQKIETARQRKLDPVKSLQYRIAEANEIVAKNTGQIMNYLFRTLGAGGIGAIAIGAMSPAVVGAIQNGFGMIGTGFHGAAGGGNLAKGGLTMLGAPFNLSAGGALVAIAGITAAIGGIVSAFKAGKHATDIFNTSLDELTINQKWAAEGAGFLTGALNFLTLGLFKGALGPTGWLTQKLALLFDAFPPLAWAMQTVMIPAKILWGVLKGIGRFIKNVFIGLWNGIKKIFKPFIEIGELVGEIFRDFQEAFGGFGIKAKDTIGIVETIASVLGGIGKGLGWVIEQVGWLIGGLIRIGLIPLKFIIGAICGLVKGILKVIMPIVKSFTKFFKGLGEIIKGIFTLDGKMFIKGLRMALYGAGEFIWEVFVGAITRLPAIFIDLVGGAIKALPKFIKNIGKFMWNTITSALIGLGDWLWSVITKPWQATGEKISGGYTGTNDSEWSSLEGAGKTAKGQIELLLGDEWSLRGQTLGRLEGLGKAAAGATEFLTGWMFEKGGKVPGQGAVPAIVHGGELIIPADYTKKGTAGVLQFLKDRYGNALPHFAKGGVVGVAPDVAAMQFAPMPQPTRDYKTATEGEMPYSPALMNYVSAKQIPMFNQSMTTVTMKGKKHLAELGNVAADVFKNKDISRMTDYARVGMAAAKDHAYRFLQYTRQIEFGNVGKMITGLTKKTAEWGKLTTGTFTKIMKAFTAISKAASGANLIKYGKNIHAVSKRIPILKKAVDLTEQGTKIIARSKFGKTIKDVSQSLGITKASMFPFSAAKMPPTTKAGRFAAAAKTKVIGAAGSAKDWFKGLKVGEVVKQLTPPYINDAIKAIAKPKTAADGGKIAKTITKALTTGKNAAKGISPPVLTKLVTEAASKVKLAKGVATLGKVSRFGGVASKLSGAAGVVGQGAGKILNIPGLSQILGGISGFLERDAATGVFKGQGIAGGIESTILGALTGGADTGSMFSGMLGIKKGGAGDEAMGVLGATGTGALGGAALGTMIAPVIGTSIGAVVGGIGGAVAELYKIMTDAGSPLKKFLDQWAPAVNIIIQPLKHLVVGIQELFGGAWKIIKGLFTLDFKSVGDGIVQMLLSIPKAIFNTVVSIVSAIVKQIFTLPKVFATVLFKLPQLVYNAIAEIFTSLGGMADKMKGPFGEILRAILTPFKIIGQIASAAGGVFGGLFDMVMGLFSFDFNRIKEGFIAAIITLPNMFGNVLGTIGKSLIGVMANVPLYILGMFKKTFIDLPKHLIGSITNGLKRLSDGILAPIFEPIYKAWLDIKGVLMEIIEPFESIFTMLKGAFYKIQEALLNIFQPFFKPLMDAKSSISKIAQLLTPLVSVLKTVLMSLIILVGAFVKIAVTVLKPIIMGLGKIIAGVANNIAGFIQILKGILTFNWDTIKEGFGKIWKGIGQMLKGVLVAIFGPITDLGQLASSSLKAVFIKFPLWAGKTMLKALKSVFVDFPAWIGETIMGGLNSVFAHFLDDMKTVFVDFPYWLFTSITKGLNDLGTWLWDHTIGALINALPAWVKKLMYHREGEQSTVSKTIAAVPGGTAIGGVNDVLKGDKIKGASKIALGGLELGAMGTPIAPAVAAWKMAQGVKGLFGYKEGTRKIIKPGLGILHEGEAVIPSDSLKGIRAEGDGAFDISKFYETLTTAGGRFANNTLMGMTTPVASMGAATVASTALPAIHDEIKKEQAGEEPTTTKVAGEELSEMVAHLKKNVDLLTAMNAHLIEMVSIMGEGSEIMPYENNGIDEVQSGASKPIAPSKYPTITVGLAAQSAGRQSRMGQSARAY